MFELMEGQQDNAVIKVVGVGGGGGNAVEHMVVENIDGVEFICANTDAQALKNSNAKIHIQLGDQLTKGLGAGANPQIGREAAEEDRDRIKEVLQGADMVFITAGMGGGTGTGAAPVFAEVAKELNILTVAVVTKPFSFEGKQRALAAEEGIRRLAEHVDSLITIPNNKLLSVLGKNISLLNAFKAANNVLLGAVKGISDLITRPGLINVDFADVRTVMSEMGMAMMGTGSAKGEQRARQAAEAAIASPLLEDVNFSGARGILVNITAGLDMSIGEFEEVGDVVKGFISDDATVVVGTVIDPEMTEEMRVTVIVTGLGDARQRQSQQNAAGRARLVETRRGDGSLDYEQLDRPAVIRKQSVAASAAKPETEAVADVDYLDIPAFLRRQEEG
ncbi:cell division protein FtsZ [Legionella oakridgensis]|uniref:Cell division protein FtsZ n=2 Tax=Legionella oakridgensis TaxID=29423 RepID=W0B8F3_9GAMM|nr:cell division protein FtsZ [Legionella oakridgensis]AHE66150.1 cell division protein FtsZ [Legionella oakridgensis ATCC 33761 = DSM 21215]ETO94015.1 cell division protein FtsZ [Legionella oakridgensis RV-2-2007]KTD43893.1 cell division protein FtsZ [Legionella oakridgensis]STY16061.1 cell division protein FtsZ [Legionella longbeachae]